MHKHKYKITLIAATLLLSGSMAGCIEDKEPDCSQENVSQFWNEEEEGTYYMGFNLQWTGETRSRADVEFEDGKHNEHQLREGGSFALFFSTEGKLVNVVDLRANHLDDDGNEVKEENMFEGRYYATYKVKKNRIKPASCLLLLNANTEIISKFAGSEPTFTLQQVLEMSWTEKWDSRKIGHYDNDSYAYLTMTNIAYVDNSGQTVCTVPIDAEKNFVAEEELINSGVNPYEPWDDTKFSENVVIVPVERMLAKFTFSIDPDNGANYDEANKIFTPTDNKMLVFTGIKNGFHQYNTTDYNFKVKITGWGINALETQNYLYKQLSPQNNYFSNWNDQTHSRSYWSEDPHYTYTKEYPFQFRQALDTPDLIYYDQLYDAAKQTNNNILSNYSYNELNNPFDATLYVPENTYDNRETYKEWKTHYPADRLHQLVGSHLILCAELLTNKNGGTSYAANDVYFDRNGVWYMSEEDFFQATVQALNNLFTSQSEMTFKNKNWGENKINDDPYEGEDIMIDTEGECYLYYGDTRVTLENFATVFNQLEKDEDGCRATAPALISNSDGQRILWFKNMSIRDKNGKPVQRCRIEGFDNRGHTIKTHLGELDDNHLKSLMYEWIGVTDHFNKGAMYYAAPIENVKDVFGVVRNTWYKFSLGNVSNLGNSVDILTQPIVPVGVTKENQLTFNVEILNWHIFEADVPF